VAIFTISGEPALLPLIFACMTIAAMSESSGAARHTTIRM
jgi:hypothetical protein